MIIFLWFREYCLQRNKSMKAGETEEEGMKQQAKNEDYDRHDKEDQCEGQRVREQQLVGQ